MDLQTDHERGRRIRVRNSETSDQEVSAMFKNMMTLIGAVATVAALTVPTAASADWSAGTSNVEVGVTVPWVGSIGFTSGIGGMSCTAVDSEWYLEPGTTGQVTSFQVTVPSCKATSGIVGCTITTATPTGMPWTMHTSGTAVEITGVEIDYTFHGAFCPYHEIRSAGTLTATPESPHAMTKVTLSNVAGAFEVYNNTSGATVSSSSALGTLVIPPTGPYGIT